MLRFVRLTMTSAAIVSILICMGCATEQRQDIRTEKRVVTITKELRQVVAPNGDIVLLEWEADAIFLRQMKRDGVGRRTRYTMWLAVRLLGWRFWRH